MINKLENESLQKPTNMSKECDADFIIGWFYLKNKYL